MKIMDLLIIQLELQIFVMITWYISFTFILLYVS